MRALVTVSAAVFSCVVLFGQRPTLTETPALVISQPGQQLFPTIAPDKAIAYSQRNGRDWDVYVLRHASLPINLTPNSPGDDWQAEFSQDGKWLAFRSERNGGGIYLMTADGKNVRRLTSAGFNPSWSADGTEVVYSSAQVVADPGYRPIRGALFAIKVATGERRIVWASSDAVQPRWSPNGRRIAFWGFASQGGRRDIWTVAAAGTDPVKVTDDEATDWNPVWSPDGRFIYFASDRGGKMEIWRVPIDQSTGQTQGPPVQVTNNNSGAVRGHIALDFGDAGFRILYADHLVSQSVERVNFDPSTARIVGQPRTVLDASLAPNQFDVSPDGETLAFYSAIPQENLYVSASAAKPRQLTNDPFRDRGPALSPDGKSLAFYSDRSGNYEIWSIGLDGTGLTQITNTPGANRSGIVWSPDGSRMAYVQRRGTTWDTYVIDPTKSPSQQIVEQLPAIGTLDEYFAPTSWSPDGQKLAGNRTFTNRAAAGGIFVYSLESKVFQMVVPRASGARWLNDGRRLIYPDAGTNNIFVVDTLSRMPVEIFTAPRGLGAIRLSPDNKTLYYVLSNAESHLWEREIPPRS